MITPSVGRVVWYYPAFVGGFTDPTIPCAALIASTIPLAGGGVNERLVYLVAWDGFGRQLDLSFGGAVPAPIPLLQDDDPTPAGGGYARWMPYQVDQAAKTEAAEKQLAAKA